MGWRMVALAITCAASIALLSASPAVTGEKPLPEAHAFLAEARTRLKSDGRLLDAYTFHERQVRVDLDEGGRPEKTTTRDFDVYPSVDGCPAYHRLVATNGKPEPLKKLQEADGRRHQALVECRREREKESAGARSSREAEERRDREEEARIVDDIPRVYQITLVGREAIRDRPAIVLTLEPRPGVKPAVDAAAAMAKLRARAWVDEHDYELVRVRLESTDTINLGWGLLARIGAGTTLTYERQKVNDEVWLPARVEAHPKARIALFRRLDAEIVSEYSDYRKAAAEPHAPTASAGPSR